MLPWYPGDFMRSTRGWSLTARGVYRELLDAQWDLGSLPPDVDELCVMIGATQEEWIKGWPKCEPKFPVFEDGQRRNPRLEEHRSKSANLVASRKRGADKTNAQRYGERSHNSTVSESLSDTLSDQSANRPALASISGSISDPSPNLSTNAKRQSASRSAACRLPDDFGLNEQRAAYATAHGLDPQRTIEGFRDYWSAASGSKARKCDWDATWRMWCRREQSTSPSPAQRLPQAPRHNAAWSEAKARAKAIGFREPYPTESASVYATEVKMAENAKPMAPIAERLGLAGIKRTGGNAASEATV